MANDGGQLSFKKFRALEKNNIIKYIYNYHCTKLDNRYKKLAGWKKSQVKTAIDSRKCRTYAHSLNNRTMKPQFPEIPYTWCNKLVNYPIQATAAEIIFACLGKLPAALDGLNAKIILSIHDEILLEVSRKDAEKAEEALTQSMIDGFLQLLPDAPTRGMVKSYISEKWEK
jgi:DNA polymerase-1